MQCAATMASLSGPRSSALLASLQKQFSVLPPVAGTCWEGGFNHLVNYGAGYYSYLYVCFCVVVADLFVSPVGLV